MFEKRQNEKIRQERSIAGCGTLVSAPVTNTA